MKYDQMYVSTELLKRGDSRLLEGKIKELGWKGWEILWYKVERRWEVENKLLCNFTGLF